jgi:serine phosphatase RsbU (regulator of sigma subunit)
VATVPAVKAGPAAGTPAPQPKPDLGSAEKLREIQSITDAALSRLAPQFLIEELVERIRQALSADTAAVLLLDPSGGHLVATAASGLEAEVTQGSRVPLGAGFAGRIAARGEPVILSAVDHTKVVNPVLLAKGIRSLMGAPLLINGEAIGVLHVGTLGQRQFTEHDLTLLQLAADRAAPAVQALMAQLDREATTALQRSLLPTALPSIGGIEVAARYVAGTGTVGGDWYDVFPLPSGETCAVIGDVTGSGLSAAVIMGRLRSALRAYALETSDPADILGRLDRKMRHFEPDALATVLCAVISADQECVRISSAGHLPPILCTADRNSCMVEITNDVLIGAHAPSERHVSTLRWPEGSVLCMYTDGLVERRDKTIDDGIDHLQQALTPVHPEPGCASIMVAMADVSSHSDDVALLVFRRTAKPEPSWARMR